MQVIVFDQELITGLHANMTAALAAGVIATADIAGEYGVDLESEWPMGPDV